MRTPLSRFLRRLLVARRRAARGLPPQAVPLADPGRRALLAGMATLPALGALGCVEPVPDTGDSGRGGGRRVLVLGAGLAGLTCCHYLARAGVRAEVVEAASRVGGRVYSVPGLFASAPERVAELGGEWINSTDTDLLALVGEFDLPLIDLYASDLAELRWFDGARLSGRELAAAIDPLITAIDAAVAGLPDTVGYADPGGAEALDQTSVAAWMEPHTAGTVADAFVRELMTADFGLETTEQSSLNLLFFLGSGAVEYDERYRILGGNGQVADTLAARYANRITSSREANALREAEDGRIEVGFTDGSVERADVVVCALPFTVLRTFALDVPLSAAKERAIRELGYGTNAKLLLPFTGRPWRASGENGIVITDNGAQMGWDPWDQQEGDAGAFANFTAGEHGAGLHQGEPVERAEELLAWLEPFWPGLSAQWTGEVARQAWPVEPTVLGSYACYRVGQWTALGGAEPEPEGALFFCGEHTSHDFQGYMNGAVESGRRAAEEVVAHLGGAARRARVSRACRRRPWVPPA